MPLNIGQATIDAVVVIGQILVVETQEMENCRIKIIEWMNILNGLAPELVRHTVADARLDSRPCHPAGESVRIVVPSLRPFLKHRHPSELGAPDH